jgi:protein TonB
VETVQSPQESSSRNEAAASADLPHVVVQGAEVDRRQEQIDLEKQRQNQLRQYGTQIYRKIAHNLSFPNDAKGTRLTGKPKIRFIVGAGGEIVGPVEIIASSGHPALDQAAIRAAQASVPFPPPYKTNLPVVMSVDFSVSK